MPRPRPPDLPRSSCTTRRYGWLFHRDDRTSKRDDELRPVKGLGVAAWPWPRGPQTHHTLNVSASNQCLSRWLGKCRMSSSTFSSRDLRASGTKTFGPPEVTVVLRDLVLEDQVVAQRVPGQLADEPVVLVEVVPRVGEDEVRIDVALERLEARPSPRRRRTGGTRRGTRGRATSTPRRPRETRRRSPGLARARSPDALRTTHVTSSRDARERA